MTNLHHLARETLHDRIVGSLIGSALGDAIGLYTEFLLAPHAAIYYPPPTSSPHHHRFSLTEPKTRFVRDSHRLPHQPGDWTDDTDQSLCILLGFLHHSSSSSSPSSSKEELLIQSFAHRLKIWAEKGLRPLDTLPLGLGFTVGSIVKNPEFLDDPRGVAMRYWEGKEAGKKPAANGSLMRTGVVGLICLGEYECLPLDDRDGYDEDEEGGRKKKKEKGEEKRVRERETVYRTAAGYSLVTHADPRCVVSCAVGTGLVRGIVKGEVREEDDIDGIVGEVVRWYEGWKLDGELDDAAGGGGSTAAAATTTALSCRTCLVRMELDRHVKPGTTLEDLKLDEQGKIGYVYKTLGAGIVTLRTAMRELKKGNNSLSVKTTLFERLITELVMCGGDADTNACFAGALLGALLGYGALPTHWKDGLRHGPWLMAKAEGLCQVLKVVEGDYDGGKDADTEPYGGKGPLPAGEMDKRWATHVQRIVDEKKEVDKTEKKKKSQGSSWKSALGLTT